MSLIGHNGGPTFRSCIDCGAPIGRQSRGRCKRCGHVRFLRPCPPDFIEMLRQLGGSQPAAKYYKSSLKTITRWRAEAGLGHGQRIRRPKRRKGVRTNAGFPGGLPRVIIFRDLSPAGEAADYLRRYGAVYRCNAEGKPVGTGIFWNRNGYVLTDADIISRAERLGWTAPEGVFTK